MSLKVLHLVHGNLNGGAARGAYWLHKGLKSLGVNSKILTTAKDTLNEDSIYSINNSITDRIKSATRAELCNTPLKFYTDRKDTMFSTFLFGYDFTNHPLYHQADIINLHRADSGFINVKHLSKIDKPIFWTIRDMSAFTGGCHYTMGCEKFKENCGFCPQLGSTHEKDLSRYLFNRKEKYISKKIIAIGISKWVTEQLKCSKIFFENEILCISNNIDCSIFFPEDKWTAREKIGINTKKKILLIGAQNPKNYYKGFSKYLSSLQYLNPDKIFLALFGDFDANILSKTRFEYKHFGYINNDADLRRIYSASDIFIAPSIEEAFGKTIAEAMACCTLPVCFNATGPKDIVDHKINGYLAQPYDPFDLANGVKWISDLSTIEYNYFSKTARNKILENFDYRIVAKKYLNAYQKEFETK